MIKTIFMGTPYFALESLKYLHENTDLKLVITKEDKTNARGNKIIYSDVKKYCMEKGLEVLQPTKLKDESFIKKMKEINPDLILVAAYGKIIPKELIQIPKYGIINVHSSILPKYRGAAPIHYALINGDKKTGVSIMEIDEGLDTGDVYEIYEVDILEEDNLESLTNKLAKLSYEALSDIVPKIINKTATKTKQNDALATIVKPISKEQIKIDFSKTNEQVRNLIRGLCPSPCAVSNLKGQRVKFYDCDLIAKDYDAKNGEVVEITKNGPIVSCAKGAILLKKIQLEGKSVAFAKDLVNGRKILLGDIFYDKN